MNTNQALRQIQWNSPTSRKSAAACAAIASALIFSSVIGLFASDNPPAGAATVATLQARHAGPASDTPSVTGNGRLASNSAMSGKL
jgi:hypothetical protein